MFNILWKGDGIKKHGSRGKWKPLGIGEHISIGKLQSMYYTFANPNNGRQASAHFGVGRKGEIWQYVDIRRAAWTQGLSGSAYGRAKAPIVIANKGVNPNLYLVSIEHEGYYEGYKDDAGEVVVENHGADGELTEVQFYATCWLHKYIQNEVKKLYGQTFALNTYSTPGHFVIDPVRKPFCPGPKFDWQHLYSELAIMDPMTLEEYEERLDYLRSDKADVSRLFTMYTRIVDLKGKLSGRYGKESARKIMLLADTVVGVGYDGEVTPEGIANRIIKLYQQWQKKEDYHEEAYRKLMLIVKGAEQLKIVA